MEIYSLTEEELQILISKATSKAEDWLFGKTENVYLMWDGTFIIDFNQGETRRDEGNAGIAVVKNHKKLVAIIREIAEHKIHAEQMNEGYPDNIL